MVQSLTYRSDIHSNVSFVALPAKRAGCFSSAHAYIHNSGLNSCQVPGVRSALVAREEESDTWFMPLIWILEWEWTAGKPTAFSLYGTIKAF